MAVTARPSNLEVQIWFNLRYPRRTGRADRIGRDARKIDAAASDEFGAAVDLTATLRQRSGWCAYAAASRLVR